MPESTDAWNALGSCFWRRNQLASARSAFTAAQSRSSNAVSLRHLSGVTRSLAHGACNGAVCPVVRPADRVSAAIGSPPYTAASVAAERQALCAESVAHAKAALALDVTDGSSWYNLGMSTLAELFITGGGVHDALAPVLKAFLQAERCGEGSRNPDLHFNRGVVLRFLEDFQAAADSFTVAGRMDDTLPWRQEVGSLIEDVARVHYLVAAHGRQKPKRIAAAAAAAATTPPPHGLALRTLAALSPGVNPGVALACRIVATASSRGAVPLVHVAVDAAGDCFALSAFGLREGALREGVATTIVAPRLAHARLQAPERALVFPLVRLDGAGGVLCGGVHPTSHSETPQLSTRRPG